MQRVFTANFTRARVEAIFNTRKFGDRTTCPSCGYRHKFYKLSDGRWQCKRCDKKFGLLTDTKINRTDFRLQEIYELLFWFELELTDHKIAKRINGNYQKIHRFYNKVRERLKEYEEDSIELLDGEVEVDETYFGADFKNRRRSKREKLRKEGRVKRGRGAKDLKEAVFGIYEREDGIVYIKPVADVTKDTLQEIIKNKVNIETRIYSDTWKSYNGLEEDFKSHRVVDHGNQEYKHGKATINGIEGFWGYAKERLLKHHGVSPENFLAYLKEKEYRFNHRHLTGEDFVNRMLQIGRKLLHETINALFYNPSVQGGESMKKITLSLVILLLVSGSLVTVAEELMVPFSAVKSSCYGEIDMSKAEFDLSELGKECVVESWLKENLDEKKAKDADEKKLDKESRIKLQGEKNAVDFSWSGLLFANKEKVVKITVRDKRFVHNIEINPTVTFLVFHDDPSGWGRVIREPGKHKFKGPGGYVEKVGLPVEKKGEEWTGRVKLLPQKSIRKISLWESPSGGPQNKHVAVVVQVFKQKDLEILKFAKEDPSLEEVAEFIDTPEELSTFMNSYFFGKHHEGWTAYSPKRFLQLRHGDCKDWAHFAAYIIEKNGYKAKQIAYIPDYSPSNRNGHVMSVFWSRGKVYLFTHNPAKILGPFKNIKELMRYEMEMRADLQHVDVYAAFPATAPNALQYLEKKLKHQSLSLKEP